MKKVICAECKRRTAMPSLPELKAEPMLRDEDDELPIDVVELMQVERRDKEIRKRLRRVWVADTTKEKDDLIEEILNRMED